MNWRWRLIVFAHRVRRGVAVPFRDGGREQLLTYREHCTRFAHYDLSYYGRSDSEDRARHPYSNERRTTRHGALINERYQRAEGPCRGLR